MQPVWDPHPILFRIPSSAALLLDPNGSESESLEMRSMFYLSLLRCRNQRSLPQADAPVVRGNLLTHPDLEGALSEQLF